MPGETEWGFFEGDIPDGVFVQFLRILDRTWQGVHWVSTGSRRRPLLANGWIIRTFRSEGRPPEYATVVSGAPRPIPAAKIDEILRARRLPPVFLALLQDQDHVYLDVSGTWLPTQLYAGLAELSPRHELLRSVDGESAFWQFRTRDWPTIRDRLTRYGLRPDLLSLESWRLAKEHTSLPTAPTLLVSNLLDDLYSRYLKKEDRINYLRTDLALEAEKPFDWADLNTVWARLLEEAKTNPTAALGVAFIRDYSFRMVDWKDSPTPGADGRLETIILSVEKNRFGGAFSGNYFRLYVPEFDTILHLSTTVSPERHTAGSADPAQTFLRRLSLTRWRAYPYLGRIRNTGAASSMSIEQVDSSSRSFVMTHLSGLPSLEALITDAGQFAAFNLDRNTWSEGHHPFSRTFVAAFEVRAGLDRYCPQPSIYARDQLGLPAQLVFDFDDFARRRRFISSLEAGQWIELVLSDALRERRPLQTDRFEFRVSPYHRIEVVARRRAEVVSALGVVKAYRSISRSGVDLLERVWSGEVSVEESLRSLRSSAHVVDIDGMWVYVPSQVSPQAVVKWEELSRRGSIDDEDRFRRSEDFARLSTHVLSMDRAHPMFWLKHTGMTRLASAGAGSTVPAIMDLTNVEARTQLNDWAAREAPWRDSGLGEKLRVMRISRGGDFRDMVSRACDTFERYGTISLRGAGSAVDTAYGVARAVEYLCAHDYPRSEVGGVWLDNPGGFKVRAIEVTLRAHGGLYRGPG